MCAICDLTLRTELIISVIVNIATFVTSITYLCLFIDEYITLYAILIGAMVLGAIAAFCVLIGIALQQKVLVVIFMLVISLVTVTFIVIFGFIGAEEWDTFDEREMAQFFVLTIGIPLSLLFSIYLAWLYFRELETGEGQMRYLGCC